MKDSASTSHPRPLVEWIFGCASALLVAALVGFLAYEAAFGDSVPPQLSAIIEETESVTGGTLVRVAVRNDGDEAVASVRLQAFAGDRPAQEAGSKDIVFDYVPARSVRRGAFLLEDGVGQRTLQLTINGFVEP